jgi:signal transduction histidine kinase
MMGHSMAKSFASSELFLLQSLASELSWAIRDLRSKKKHRKLLATVSHELKNPLQVIVGHSALLHDHLAQACSRQQLEQFQNIEVSAQQILDLINGLVDGAVAHAGNLSVLEEPVDLIATLQEIFAFFRKVAEERGIKFEAGLAADLPTTFVTDPVKFKQIVRNLIDSVMISTDEGKVEVVVKRGKGMLEIVAKESGVGITGKSDRTHCESASPGSDFLSSEVRGGIGLRVVKEFSDLLKGHVHVQTRPGEGAEFTVCLPCE